MMRGRRLLAVALLFTAVLASSASAQSYGLFQDYFPPSADMQMNTHPSEGYANTSEGAFRMAKYDHHFGMIAFDEVGDNSGVDLATWLVDKQIVSATLYVRASGTGDLCDPFGTDTISEPTEIIGLRVGNAGLLSDRNNAGSGLPSQGCCKNYLETLFTGGETGPVAWKMGEPPYLAKGDIGGNLPGQYQGEWWIMSYGDQNSPGLPVHVNAGGAMDAFDADSDGNGGYSGDVDTETQNNLQDGQFAFEYIMRHATNLVTNSETLDNADCTGLQGEVEPRNADGQALGGWFAVPLDRCLVTLLAKDPEMKALVLSAMLTATVHKDTSLFARDQGGGEYEPYLDLKATVIGDVDSDGEVSVLDVVSVVNGFGKTPLDPGFDTDFDVDCDNEVSVLDIVACVVNFGQNTGL